MAARLGVVQSTLCRWEAGEREPQGENLRRVEQELNDGTMPTSSSAELVYRHDV
jgi:hypothetical protein